MPISTDASRSCWPRPVTPVLEKCKSFVSQDPPRSTAVENAKVTKRLSFLLALVIICLATLDAKRTQSFHYFSNSTIGGDQ